MTQKKSASAAKSKAAPKSPKSTAKSPAKKAAPQGQDIVQLILDDHKTLKKLIKVMKDSDTSNKARKQAFEEFWPLLLAHAKPEEQSLYNHIKKNSEELRMEAFEGDVEHGLADQMVEEAKRTTESDLFQARVKVLAELVEHHIEEEEEELLPDFKKEADIQVRRELGAAFLELKEMQRKELRQVKTAAHLESRASH